MTDVATLAVPVTPSSLLPESTPELNMLCVPGSVPPPPEWVLCHNERFGFELAYPENGKLTNHTATQVQIHLPFPEGTNLLEKYLEIAVVDNAQTCSSPQAIGYEPGLIPRETVQLENSTFVREEGMGAGAGNTYQWISYSTAQDRVCLTITLLLHSFPPQMAATPVVEFDPPTETKILEEIVATFHWLNPSPFPTATAERPAARINFASGAVSATISGDLHPSESDLYVLKAQAGQTMQVDLTFNEGAAILVVWGADGTVLLTDHAEVAHFQGSLPTTQDYFILVKGNPTSPTLYNLTVTIPPAVTAVPPTPAPKRIELATGATSATISGDLQPFEADQFVIRALGGQTMQVDLTFPEGAAILVIWGADGTVLISDHAEASHFEGVLPLSQDYFILIKGNPTTDTVYNLTITIPPLSP